MDNPAHTPAVLEGMDPALQRKLQDTKSLLAGLRSGKALVTPDAIQLPPSPPRRAAPASDLTKPTSIPPPRHAAEATAPLHIMLQCGQGRSLAVTVAPSDTLSVAFDVFSKHAVQAGWMASTGQSLRFVFDGEPLSGESTVAEAGLEDDDVVDVVGI